MKIFLVLLLFIGCYDDPTESCTKYKDLCGTGGNDTYKVCADEYGSWFEVDGEVYHTTDYMLMMECGFKK